MYPEYHLHKVVYCLLISFVLNSQSRPLPLPWFSVPKYFLLSWNWNSPVSCKSLWCSRYNFYSEDHAWALELMFSSESSKGRDLVKCFFVEFSCNSECIPPPFFFKRDNSKTSLSVIKETHALFWDEGWRGKKIYFGFVIHRHTMLQFWSLSRSYIFCLLR